MSKDSHIWFLQNKLTEKNKELHSLKVIIYQLKKKYHCTEEEIRNLLDAYDARTIKKFPKASRNDSVIEEI